MTAPGRTGRIAAAVLLLWSLALASAAPAADTKNPAGETPGERLKELEKAIDQGRQKSKALQDRAREIDDQLARIRRDMVAAATIIQEQERRALALEGDLAQLNVQEHAKLVRLQARRGQLAGVLVALQRVARYPPEALMTQPIPPADTVRSAILLRSTVPAIEERAVRLRADLDDLAQSRQAIAAKKAQLAQVTAGLEAERLRMSALYGQQTALKHRTMAQARAETRRIRAIEQEAKDLMELLDRVRKSRRRFPEPSVAKKPETAKPDEQATLEGLPAGLTGVPITNQRGKLPPPAVGRLLGRYGEVTSTGLTQKGLTFETQAAAQVVAPYEGNVVYAGRFRGYGELLIIEHGEGYHSLLAGLARIDCTIGQWVVAGEPVGVMDSSGNRKPVLYVELRRNGQPINPLPWLAAQR